jgi:hypothetical protein
LFRWTSSSPSRIFDVFQTRSRSVLWCAKASRALSESYSGKSSLLKFFYEFRNLFQVLCNPSQMAPALSGPYPFQFSSSIFDPQHDVFFNANTRDLVIEVRLVLAPGESYGNPSITPEVVALTIPRGTNTVFVKLYFPDGPLSVPPDRMLSGAHVSFGGQDQSRPATVLQCFQLAC